MTQTTPDPLTRTLLHTRQVNCTGHACSDGTLQIDAVMQDITANGTDLYFKRLTAGDVIHGMRLTVTLDADLVIQDVAAQTDTAPTPWCTDANPAYAVLKGLKIGPGFTRQVKALLGGHERVYSSDRVAGAIGDHRHADLVRRPAGDREHESASRRRGPHTQAPRRGYLSGLSCRGPGHPGHLAGASPARVSMPPCMGQ